MYRNQEAWKKAYEELGALWIHDENALRPHALLTSGKHSNGFFNSEIVMENPTLVDEATSDLLELLILAGLSPYRTDRVVGPAMGAITLAHDLARHVARFSVKPCLRAYVEKVAGCDKMAFTRTSIRAGEHILFVEDVVTTGQSISKSISLVERSGGIPHCYMAVLVNRSGHTSMLGCRIVALISHEMPVWEAAHCPLCKDGSEAIRPKDAENWKRLNAIY